MQILFLSPRQCWPPRSGAKLREYHFAKALGNAAQLTLLHFADPASGPLAPPDLPFCRTLRTLPKPAPYTPGKILRGLFGPWPLPVLNYSAPAMAQTAVSFAAGNSYDYVHLESIHMAVYCAPLRQALAHSPARFVLNWHNIESELMRRYAANAPDPARRLYAAYTARRLASLERRLLSQAFGHIVCSARERDLLLQIAPAARVAVVENGVDTAYFQPAPSSPPSAPRWLVFVGLMNYHANVEAAVHFARHVWPTVSGRFPHLGFRIVGADPAPPVRALRDLPGIEVTGTVPDVRPYYSDALAAVVPLQTGGGTRLKILEAMASGVPVVSTSLGAEGLEVEPERHLLLAEDPAAWLRSLARLAESPAFAASLAASALDRVRNRYDWEILGARLAATYREWLRLPA